MADLRQRLLWLMAAGVAAEFTGVPVTDILTAPGVAGRQPPGPARGRACAVWLARDLCGLRPTEIAALSGLDRCSVHKAHERAALDYLLSPSCPRLEAAADLIGEFMAALPHG